MKFFKHQVKYNVTYTNRAEMVAAFSIFEVTYMKTLRQQLSFYVNESNFLMKLNKFATLDDKSVLNGAILNEKVTADAQIMGRAFNLPAYPTPPKSLDYRTMGLVTSVQDQGMN